ncbi:MAG: DUF2778 domain-containing protein [Hyphomicrobiales bacterium]|nr:DUF2778 domain-containing protein [Hyphomicrobiales bacterium]
MRKIDPPPPRISHDFTILDETDPSVLEMRLAPDKLAFDGYFLTWSSSGNSTKYTAFSGQANESAKESVKDLGPIPQGEYAIDPGNIETFEESDDWGSYRVKSDPIKKTVKRMEKCFGVIRTGMYIHGGNELGTAGCIELNADTEEKAFFAKLEKYGKKIQLIVKYTGKREKKYEESKCPY